jgi:hypothetical protein
MFHKGSGICSAWTPYNLFVGGPVDFVNGFLAPIEDPSKVSKITRKCGGLSEARFVVARDGVSLYDQLSLCCWKEWLYRPSDDSV